MATLTLAYTGTHDYHNMIENLKLFSVKATRHSAKLTLNGTNIL